MLAKKTIKKVERFMNYIGKGLLVGYKTYKKDNIDKHVYYVLNGNKDEKNGLYNDLEFITIVQEQQTIENLRPQLVTFEIASQTFAGQTKNRFLNIQSIKEEV